MSKKAHGLGYRIWNQMRLAMHVDSYHQIYDELNNTKTTEGWPNGVWKVLATTRKALFETIIIHLDMIKAKQGISLYSLIEEAKKTGYIGQQLHDNLRNKIDKHTLALKHVNRLRNNLIAHRSPSLTFREVKDKFPVTDEDLVALSLTYYNIAKVLHTKVPFSRPWDLVDRRMGTKSLIECLGK